MTYPNHVDNAGTFFLELLFPSFCLGCQKEGSYLCQDCRATLEISEHCYCLCNKNPLRLPSEILKGTCQRCQGKMLSGLYFALNYKEKFLTKKLIRHFKYPPYIKSLAKDIAKIVIEHLLKTGKNTNEIWEGSILVPVPMEIKKQKNRGYNQAEELAKEISNIIKVPLAPNNLVKIKKTLPQIKLSAQERQENLKGAFLVKNPEEIKHKKIFLVDDVYTTGSTMESCAQALKKAGAKNIWAIAIAREA